MPRPMNALTIDVEDWYQGIEVAPEYWESYESRIGESLPLLLDLLAEYDVKATFFVLGWLAEREPQLIKRIKACGHDIGTHGYSHRLIYKLDRQLFTQDLRKSIVLLEDLIGAPINAHRAPFFSITRESQWALEILVENRITLDSSIFPVRNYRYGIPDAPRFPYRFEHDSKELVEFPISTWRFLNGNRPFAGGFYLRFLPYAFIKHGIKSINREGYPVVVYLHPWELDPEHPRIPLPKRIALTHYHNLQSTEDKLRRLLSDFDFNSLGEVTSTIQL